MSTATGEALDRFSAGTVLLKDILESSLVLLLHKVTRNSQEVRAEYDQGRWKTILNERRWVHTSDLNQFLVPATNEVRIAKIANEYVWIPTQEYYRYRTRMLQTVIKEFAGDDLELVELGCGVGINLFSVLPLKEWHQLIGLDVSGNAIKAATEISQHFGIQDKVRFGHCDLMNGQDPSFTKLTGKVVFTYYCLEQLKYSTHAVIENMRRAGPKKVIHIEPTTELLNLWSPKDLANYLYIRRKDYQDNLLGTLRAFERRGDIKVLEVRRLYYAPTIKHDPTLICWESVASYT